MSGLIRTPDEERPRPSKSPAEAASPEVPQQGKHDEYNDDDPDQVIHGMLPRRSVH